MKSDMKALYSESKSSTITTAAYELISVNSVL